LIQQRLKQKDMEIDELKEQVKNIDKIVGQRFSELFEEFGLVDYKKTNAKIFYNISEKKNIQNK
jgi:hypothetical protein